MPEGLNLSMSTNITNNLYMAYEQKEAMLTWGTKAIYFKFVVRIYLQDLSQGKKAKNRGVDR